VIREERLAILGLEVAAYVHELVKAAPEPTPEVVEKLRRIMTNSARAVPDGDR
jgi:hypothetical protein